MTVLIAGGGIAGLSLALTCHQIGVQALVLESVRNVAPLGVGINLQPNAVRELIDLGFGDDLDAIGIEATEWALVLTLFGLSVIDWGWTVAHLQRGTPEANPLLLWALEAGGLAAFTAVKLGVTAAVSGFLLVHMRFRLTRALLPVALLCYAGVIGIHIATEAVTRSA